MLFSWPIERPAIEIPAQKPEILAYSFQFWAEKNASVAWTKLVTAQICAIQAVNFSVFRLEMGIARWHLHVDYQGMFTELYIETLLIDPDLVGDVWGTEGISVFSG